MGLIPELQNASIISVDSTVLIYYIEKEPKYFDFLAKLFARCDSLRNPLKLVTSSVSLIEVLVKPIRDNRAEMKS